MTRQALHTWIWGFSAIVLCTSFQASSGWVGTVDGLPFSGLSRGDWEWVQVRALAEPPKDIHRVIAKLLLHCLAVCLWSLSCWKVNLRPRLRSWVLRTRSLLWISLCNAPFSSPSSPSHCHWKTPTKHDAATTMLQRRDGTGQVMSGAGFPPDMRLKKWGQIVQSWFHRIRESSFFFLQTPCGLSSVFQWGEAAIWPLCHKAQISWVLQWWFCVSHLHTGSLKLSESDQWVLGHLSYQSPPSPITQFSQAASSRSSPGCSKHLPFKRPGCSWGLFMRQICFCSLSRVCVSTQSCLWALQDAPSTSWLGFCFKMHRQPRDLRPRCVPFQIMSS